MLKRIIQKGRKMLMENNITYWLNEYRSKFNDSYPLEQVCETKEESIEAIKKCLKNNRPLVMDIEGKDY